MYTVNSYHERLRYCSAEVESAIFDYVVHETGEIKSISAVVLWSYGSRVAAISYDLETVILFSAMEIQRNDFVAYKEIFGRLWRWLL